MKVRPAKAKDAASFYKFICELEETSFDYPVFERYYRANLSDPDNIYLVSVDEAEIVTGCLSCHGQVLLHHLSMVYEIQELYVDRGYRNRNIGQLLVESLEAILKERKHGFLEVTTNLKRLDAHRFYLKCGFIATHYKFTKTL